MRTARLVALAAVLLALFALSVSPARADRGGVVRFATLPSGPGHPEGIAADAAGTIYAASFSFAPPNFVYAFGSDSALLFAVELPGTVPLGMAFDGGGNLWIADFGNGRLLRFSPPLSGASAPSKTIQVCTLDLFVDCGLNAIAFDAAGSLYVSDSFGGKVYRITDPNGTKMKVRVHVAHELLKPHGFPPFGANGLAFDPAGDLFVANTADDRVLKVSPKDSISVFAEGIDGSDGMTFVDGALWVAANQADEVVALDANGVIIDRRGSFEGIGVDGAPKGLLFPASVVASRGSLYVTNAALALTPTSGDEPEENVTTFTVSRIPLGPARP